jgi:hypothetical protein
LLPAPTRGSIVDMANPSRAVCQDESKNRRFGNPPYESPSQGRGIMRDDTQRKCRLNYRSISNEIVINEP